MRAGLVGVEKASLFDTNGANKFLNVRSKY